MTDLTENNCDDEDENNSFFVLLLVLIIFFGSLSIIVGIVTIKLYFMMHTSKNAQGTLSSPLL